MPTRSKLIDVNVLSIFLVENHPGHPYVEPIVSRGLTGEYKLCVPDQLPLRARWVLTTRWGIPKEEADQAIEDFLEHRRVRYVAGTRTTLRNAYDLSRALRHDVYDAFYLALARDHGLSAIVTTDTDFRSLCRGSGVDYENPVPSQVLTRFGAGPRS